MPNAVKHALVHDEGPFSDVSIRIHLACATVVTGDRPERVMKVAELMQKNLKTISVDATVEDAVAALADAGVSALPVIDRFGRAVGVVSTRDVLEAERAHSRPRAREHLLRRGRVLEVMNPWPLTISPDADVHQAAQEMLYFDARRLFVEHEGALVGVITQTDLVRALATGRLRATAEVAA
jgi:acetoin utilization protein AcuB